MKKTTLFMLTGAFLFTSTLQSCIGSFNLTKKVYEFNKGVGDKWIQELVFLLFVILPVYEVALLIDGVILNLIEFWTGSNPMSMNEGEIEIQYKKGIDGNMYQLTATKNKFHVLQIDGADKGKEMAFVYNPENTSWSLEQNGTATLISTVNFNENGLADNYTIFYQDGSSINVNAQMSKEQASSLVLKNQPNLASAK
jgi:hypothetical protein